MDGRYLPIFRNAVASNSLLDPDHNQGMYNVIRAPIKVSSWSRIPIRVWNWIRKQCKRRATIANNSQYGSSKLTDRSGSISGSEVGSGSLSISRSYPQQIFVVRIYATQLIQIRVFSLIRIPIRGWSWIRIPMRLWNWIWNHRAQCMRRGKFYQYFGMQIYPPHGEIQIRS